MESNAILESKINLLEVLFSHTFLATTRENYLITFKTSSIVDEMEILEEFYTQLSSSRPTKQNTKDLGHLTTLIETYTTLIIEYKKLNAIQNLPSNLKRSSLLQYLRKYVSTPVNTKTVIKEVIQEMSMPIFKESSKLTIEEIILNSTKKAINRGKKSK